MGERYGISRTRLATVDDLDDIAGILADATAFLGAQGSPQWQGGYGPDRASAGRDIAAGQGYVYLHEGGVRGYAALVPGVDEAYTNIDGQWAGESGPYISVHSMATGAAVRGKGAGKGFLRELVSVAGGLGYRDVRIDTHALNTIMQKVILDTGFVYRGTVTFPIPHGERMAYQLLLD